MQVDIKTLQRDHPAVFAKEYEAWQHHCCDYEWWDGVYEGFIEDMKEHGVSISTSKSWGCGIYFSLGYSQSDYAAFEGTITMTTWMEKHGYKAKYFPLWLDMQDYGARSSVRHNHRGGCTQSLDYSPGNCSPSNIYAGMDQEAWDALVTTMFEEEDWDKLLDDWLRSTCADLYQRLQDEYEYLTSEEAFVESQCDAVFEIETEEEV